MYSQYRKQNASSNKLPKLKLTYFDAKGRAETTRYILAFGEVEYEDERIEQSSWAELKPKTEFGYLPQLEANGVPIGNSAAIQRYVAGIAGLTGQNPEEAAMIESLSECVTDIREGLFKSVFLPEDQKAEAFKKLQEETIPNILSILEDFKTKNGGKYMAGDKVSWADLHFAAVWESVMGAVSNKLSPSLQEVFDGIRESPSISKYLKDRKETKF